MNLIDVLTDVLDVEAVEELEGGHQARVFRVVRHGVAMVAKAHDSLAVERRDLEARLDVMTSLAVLGQPVCRPLPIGDDIVLEIESERGGGYLVCFEFAAGREPNPAAAHDSAVMGAALSQLHAAMAQLPVMPLPPVAALATTSIEAEPALGSAQLLHGDFSASNLRDKGGELKIFDFDDCGYGPPEFDVANALYMVLFDSVVQGTPETYETFRPAFVAGYGAHLSRVVRDETLDSLIAFRVRALGRWLDDLETAPTGIRNASREWLATLQSFVEAKS